MSKREAMKLFKAGYNCCQAVVGAFSDDIEIDFKTAMLISLVLWRWNGEDAGSLRHCLRHAYGFRAKVWIF